MESPVLISVSRSDEPLEELVNQDLQLFNEWFQSLGNDPLVKGETSILKTYLAWKLKVKK
jgi:hypothetical protein